MHLCLICGLGCEITYSRARVEILTFAYEFMAKHSLIRDISGVMGSNILAMVSTLGISILLSRVLGPQGYGLFTSLYVVPQVVMGLVQLGMSRSAVFHLGHKKFNECQTISSIYVMLCMTSTVGIIVSAIAYAILNNPLLETNWILLALCIIPFALGNIYTSGIFIGKEDIQTSNKIYWIPVTLNLILTAITVGILQWGITGALIANLLATATIFFVFLLRIHHQYALSFRFDTKILKSLASKGLGFALAFVMLQLNYKVDILLLQKLAKPSEIGYYALGVSVTEQLWLLPYAIGVVLMSRTANATNERMMAKTTALMVRICLPAALIAALVLIALTPPLLPLIFGKSFIPSIRVVQTILPGIVIFMIFRIIESYFAGLGKPMLSVMTLIPSLLLNIILNLLWIPRYGIIGSAMATNFSYAFATIIFLFVFQKYSRLSFKELLILKPPDLQRLKKGGRENGGKEMRRREEEGTIRV